MGRGQPHDPGGRLHGGNDWPDLRFAQPTDLGDHAPGDGRVHLRQWRAAADDDGAGQSTVNYTWNNANRLTQIAQGSSAVGFVYDNVNQRTTLTLPNNVTVAYTYDNDSRVSGMTYSAGSTQLGNLTYNYDADGRRTSNGGSLAAVTLPSAVNGNTFNVDNGMTGFNGTTPSLTITWGLLRGWRATRPRS
ncbi:MAG: hypothetical protein ACXWCH_33065 [Burkholderiales bacterium]